MLSNTLHIRYFALISALLVVVLCSMRAFAQQDSGGSYWVMERQREHALQMRATPRVRIARPRRIYQGVRQPSIRRRAAYIPPERQIRVVPKQQIVPTDFVVAVIGNGMSLSLAQGLQANFASQRNIAFLHEGKPLSGLVRDDFYNWTKKGAELLAGPQHIDLAVMLIGSNDHQPMLDGTVMVPPQTPRWNEIYAQRIAAINQVFAAKHVPLIWVGLPVVKSAKLSAAYIAFNDMYRAEAAKSNSVYIDVWDAFLNDSGSFNAYGPDVNGETMKLRTIDGIHFTMAGAAKLAHFVEASIKHDYELVHPATEPVLANIMPRSDAATPVDALPALAVPLAGPQPAPAAAPQPGAGALPASIEASLKVALPPPDLPPALHIPVKPAAGPIMRLAAPDFGSSAALLNSPPPLPADNQASASINRAFRDGDLPNPEPGRADTFAWPQH